VHMMSEQFLALWVMWLKRFIN